ncbi:MAG: dicarboxylate/amino acid:cation symporter, partial [Fimbriiglobus sp.]
SHTRILAGLIGGAVVGCGVNYLVSAGTLSEESVKWFVKNFTKPVGDVFLNLLFLAIIPLVFASLAIGVTRLGGAGNVGRVGAKTLAYFLVTTACAAAIGLTLVNIIRPGDRITPEQKEKLKAQFGKEATEKTEKKPEFGVETFTSIIPKNLAKAFTDMNMLSIIFVAVLTGIALGRIDPDKAKALMDVLEAVNQITDFVIRLAMSLAPFAVFALIFGTTALFGVELLLALGAFVGTVLGGLAIHLLVVLPVLVLVFGRRNPVVFFLKIRGVMVTAFGTSSSSATLPAAIACAENELGVPPPVARFVLPLSASMNHNGTALFEGVTVMFLAQAFGVTLEFDQQLMVLLLCVLTATGMAGVPGGSLPLIGLILARFDVPPAGIALVLGVDRILDMCRTTVNVAADMTTVVFVARAEAAAANAGPASPATAETPAIPTH